MGAYFFRLDAECVSKALTKALAEKGIYTNQVLLMPPFDVS